MRNFLLILVLFFSSLSYGQAFHFNDTVTVLIKNVTQSPAHWYLEIYNDVGVDTTLRWKTHFVNVPAQWNINFDDQNTAYSTINDGDSADFICYAGLPFAQKLIIGAEFNGVPGNASIFFDIYDPADPSYVVTIEYRYIVSAVGLNEIAIDNLINYKNGKISFDPSLQGGSFQVIDYAGRILLTETITGEDVQLNSNGSKVVIVRVQCEEGTATKRIFLNE